jgi:beta-glucosidase
VKFKAGLFERPLPEPAHLSLVGTADHRQLAREAVAKSLVLLKNEAQTLPLSKSTPTILVAGQAADDIGLQCGGWTIEWLGKPGSITPGRTILEGIDSAVSQSSQVIYDPGGHFEQLGDLVSEIGIVVLSEMPYAEGFGDQADLTLPKEDILLIQRLHARCHKLVMILLSGRPLILTSQLPLDRRPGGSLAAGHRRPGSGRCAFRRPAFHGKLPYSWPQGMQQIPLEKDMDPLFPLGGGIVLGK